MNGAVCNHFSDSSAPSHATSLSFRYKLMEEVGRGSFGIVRKVQDKLSRNYYACKTLSKEMDTPIYLLQREVESLDGIHHPHLLELQAVYEEPRYIHLVTEICTGGELYERITNSSTTKWIITEAEAAELMHNILRGIAYCHKHGIVHRDLKASNFLFVTPDTNTNVKIIDFGLARRTFKKNEHDNDDDDDDDGSEWVMRSKVGTPYYVAPEVLTDESYTSKCDVWSIGVIAYLVLSGGTLPFCGKDEADTLRLLEDPDLNVEFVMEDSSWNNFDESARDFCRALLQKDPKKRPTAEAALELKWLHDNYTAPDPPCLESDPRLLHHHSSADRIREAFDYIFHKSKTFG